MLNNLTGGDFSQAAPVARKALGVNPAGAAGGADLGGSSKYSREALEDRCGEGFRVNSRWTRVSRSWGLGEALFNRGA